MAKSVYVAIDLGAESGRTITGLLDGDQLTLQEVHRFQHLALRLPTGLHWNLTDLWANVLEGLRAAVTWSKEQGVELSSVGVDTWGVDWAALAAGGELLGLPHCYRDEQHGVAFRRLMEDPGGNALYDATGIQLMALNTLFQAVARHDSEPTLLNNADKFLFMPDLFHYLLTGQAMVESSIASTSQMTDPRTGDWAIGLLQQLGLPTQMLTEIVPTGTTVGTLLPEIAAEVGAETSLRVIAPASHDTAAAVAAVPAIAGTDWCYVSSGTWSLMGCELDEPVLTDAAREAPFTNEGGVGGSIRFLKNIIGLWLVQECRRAFQKSGQDLDYVQLTEAAAAAEPFRTILNPEHAPFMLPGEMPEKIAAYARETGQPEPETPGQFVRCCLETLALTYRRTLNKLEQVTDRRYDVLHIVGGGGKNELLNQFTADALDRTIVVGPEEATAVGNVLTQAMGAGDVEDLDHIRTIVRASFEPKTYEPLDAAGWNEAYDRFERLCGNA